jgi:hypothetical protein
VPVQSGTLPLDNGTRFCPLIQHREGTQLEPSRCMLADFRSSAGCAWAALPNLNSSQALLRPPRACFRLVSTACIVSRQLDRSEDQLDLTSAGWTKEITFKPESSFLTASGDAVYALRLPSSSCSGAPACMCCRWCVMHAEHECSLLRMREHGMARQQLHHFNASFKKTQSGRDQE